MSKIIERSIIKNLGAGDFENLHTELVGFLEDPKERVFLKLETEDNPHSYIDKILLSMPRFIVATNNQIDPSVLKVVDLLLEEGADPNRKFKNGITPFLLACTVDCPDLIKKLMNNPKVYKDTKGNPYFKQANINTSDNMGNRAFYYATMTNALNTMDFLVNECKVDINASSILNNNETVLHQLCAKIVSTVKVHSDGLFFDHAVNTDKMQALDKLLDMKVDPTLTNHYDQTAEELVPQEVESSPNISMSGDFNELDKEQFGDIFQNVGKVIGVGSGGGSITVGEPEINTAEFLDEVYNKVSDYRIALEKTQKEEKVTTTFRTSF